MYDLFLILTTYSSYSSVSLKATVDLLPGGLLLSPQQGISRTVLSTLKQCLLTNHYSEKYDNTLILSQIFCSKACV